MPLLQAIILALVQGITEFLPISSTAHLALAPWLLGWKDPGLTFDIALHVGTLAAVLAFFFRDWLQVVAQGFGLSWGSDPQLKQNPCCCGTWPRRRFPSACLDSFLKSRPRN